MNDIRSILRKYKRKYDKGEDVKFEVEYMYVKILSVIPDTMLTEQDINELKNLFKKWFGLDLPLSSSPVSDLSLKTGIAIRNKNLEGALLGIKILKEIDPERSKEYDRWKEKIKRKENSI